MSASYVFLFSWVNPGDEAYALNISGGVPNSGTSIILYPWDSGAQNEQWYLGDDGSIVSQLETNGQQWAIEMDAQGNLTLQPYVPGNSNQQWAIAGGLIENLATEMVLSATAPGSSETVIGVPKPDTPADNLLWVIQPGNMPDTSVCIFNYPGVGQNGYALNVDKNDAFVGAQIIVYLIPAGNVPGLNDQWVLLNNGYITTAMQPGWLALEMDASGSVTLQWISNGTNQQWVVSNNMIQNVGTGMFLSVSGALGTNPLATGVPTPAIPSSNVLWQIAPSGDGFTPIEPVYIFTHLAGSGNPYALNISGGQAVAGAQIILYPGSQVDNEQWYLWQDGYIISVIDAEQGWAIEMDAGGNVTLQAMANTPNQQWSFAQGMIQNQGTGMVLAVDQALSSNPPVIAAPEPPQPGNWVLWRIGPYNDNTSFAYIFTNLSTAQSPYVLAVLVYNPPFPITVGTPLGLTPLTDQGWAFFQDSYIVSQFQDNGVLWVLDMNAAGDVYLTPIGNSTNPYWICADGMIQNQITGLVLTVPGHLSSGEVIVGKPRPKVPDTSNQFHIGTTWSGQNEISLPQYDMVVAVTQASVNETLALFLAGLDENVGLYYNVDSSGNLSPAPDQSTADYAFTGTLGYTRDSVGNPVDLVLLYSGKGPRTVTYNITFNNAEFKSTVQPVFDYKQEKGNPWIISFSVNLTITNVAMSDLPQATQETIGTAVSGLDPGSFYIQQLYLDLNTAVFDTFQNITGVPEDDNAAQILSAIMKDYLAGLQSTGGVIFGYNVQASSPSDSSPTFLPAAIDFCITPYTDPFGNYSNSSLDTLNYLIMVNDDQLPSGPPLSFGFNWVNTPDIQGSIAVSSGIYLPYLIGQLNEILQTISPVCYVQASLDQDQDNQTMQLNQGSPNVFWLSPPADGVIAQYSYTSPTAFDKTSDGTSFASVQLDYSSSCSVSVNGTTVTLSGQSIVSGQTEVSIQDSIPQQAIMLPATYSWSVDLVLSMDLTNNGQIDYGIENASFDNPPTVAPDNRSGWQKFLDAISGNFDIFVSDPGNIRETMSTQVLNQIQQVLIQGINSSNQFVFPGGGVFLFKNPTFTDTLDLTANITYQSPS